MHTSKIPTDLLRWVLLTYTVFLAIVLSLFPSRSLCHMWKSRILFFCWIMGGSQPLLLLLTLSVWLNLFASINSTASSYATFIQKNVKKWSDLSNSCVHDLNQSLLVSFFFFKFLILICVKLNTVGSLWHASSFVLSHTLSVCINWFIQTNQQQMFFFVYVENQNVYSI